MAIRYSGDIEVRVIYTRGIYKGSVRAPGFNCHGTMSPKDAKVKRTPYNSPEAYDQVSRTFILSAMALLKRMNKKGGRLYPETSGKNIIVRRTFQSPCPYRDFM